MAEEAAEESPFELWSDCKETWSDSSGDSLLELSLPDNTQTWLYCTPNSDPNSRCDLTNFLSIKSDKLNTSEQGYPINTRTYTRQKRQSSYGISKKVHEDPCKSSSPTKQEKISASNSLMDSTFSQAPKIMDVKHTESFKKEQSLTDTSIITEKSIKKSQETSDWDISEHTLIGDVSAPSILVDSSLSSKWSDYIQKLKRSSVSFQPSSSSTPTKKLVTEEKDAISLKQNISEGLDGNTIESRADNTFNISTTSKFHETLHSYISKVQLIEKAFEEDIHNDPLQGVLDSTFTIDDFVKSDSEDLKKLSVDNEEDKSAVDHCAVDAPQEGLAELNSTIVLKSKDPDSEQDSCYSSFSNLRSIGDMCAISQLQQKSRPLDPSMKKARSENFLWFSKDTESKIEADKQHSGSDLNLAPQWSYHSTDGKSMEKVADKEKNRLGQSSSSSLEQSSKPENVVKAPPTKKTSRIPRPQSRIPKLSIKRT